jgi:LacI family transcriptional regulator
MATARLKADLSLIVYADFLEDRSHELCRGLLGRSDRPTALFVSNNQMLIGALQAMKDLNLSCPADLSITAIDDFPWANVVLPRLTVQAQPIDEIADTAVRLLLSRMTSGSTAPHERVVLPARLVLRDSTRPFEVTIRESSLTEL